MIRSRPRDPVELLLARILRRGLQGSFWSGAASVALGCSSDDAADRAETEDFAASVDAANMRDAAGRNGLDGGAASDVALDARAVTGLRDAVVPTQRPSDAGPGGDASRDAATLLDAGSASDAAAPPDAVALECPAQGRLPVQAARLRPALAYDYVAVREVQGTDFSGFSGDAGVESWTRDAFMTLSETGTRCATATNDACKTKVAAHPQQLVRSYCVQICTEYSVVTTSGDQVERWATGTELAQLLAPIDSFDDALMLVASAGYSLTCNDAVRSSVREVADGYEVYATRITSDCAPVITTRYRLLVARDGAIRELDSVELEHSANVCIGRIPAGLTSVSVDRRQSALGDYLARCAHLEAASVHAFERLARELFTYGAPSELVDAALEAAGDEVEHARAIGALARAHGGEPVGAEVATLPQRSLEEIATENAVEGCVRETYGALVGAYQAEHASEPRLRRAMVKIAADEARHAALSQRVHTWAMSALEEPARARVHAAQQRAIAALASECGVAREHEALRQQAGLPQHQLARWFVSELRAALWGRGVASVA